MAAPIRELDRARARPDFEQLRQDAAHYTAAQGRYPDEDDACWDDPQFAGHAIARIYSCANDGDLALAYMAILAVEGDVDSQAAFAIGIGDNLIWHIDGKQIDSNPTPAEEMLRRLLAEARQDETWRIMLATTNWYTAGAEVQTAIEAVILPKP